MIHFGLLVVCVLAIEIFILFRFFKSLYSNVEIAIKVLKILPNKKISDHWKEKVILNYAISLMKNSFQLFFILISVIVLFLGVDYFYDDFINYTLSLLGILESILIIFIYTKLRNLIWDH